MVIVRQTCALSVGVPSDVLVPDTHSSELRTNDISPSHELGVACRAQADRGLVTFLLVHYFDNSLALQCAQLTLASTSIANIQQIQWRFIGSCQPGAHVIPYTATWPELFLKCLLQETIKLFLKHNLSLSYSLFFTYSVDLLPRCLVFLRTPSHEPNFVSLAVVF